MYKSEILLAWYTNKTVISACFPPVLGKWFENCNQLLITHYFTNYSVAKVMRYSTHFSAQHCQRFLWITPHPPQPHSTSAVFNTCRKTEWDTVAGPAGRALQFPGIYGPTTPTLALVTPHSSPEALTSASRFTHLPTLNKTRWLLCEAENWLGQAFPLLQHYSESDMTQNNRK